MLENMILEHNEGITVIEKDIEALRYKLSLDLQKGDALKVEEISEFVMKNNLDRVWFLNDHFDIVYGGRLFDIDGLKKRLTARGTISGECLLKLMQSAFEFERKETTIAYDDDAKVITILVFTLKK